MKDKWLGKQRFLLIIIIVYIILGIAIVSDQFNYITNYQYMSLGENALNLAELAAKTLHINNKDVEVLEGLNFKESQLHPLNIELEELFQFKEKNLSILYVYILRKLPDNNIKYEIDASDTEFYALPIGTKLNGIWLLDVIVDSKKKSEAITSEDYYKDKNRYTSIEEDLLNLLIKEETNYLLSDGEWGKVISGLAPIYTEEGEYIGLLGVDLQSESFYKYRFNIFLALSILFLIPTLFMSLLYIYLHLSYRKKMNELAYKDQLTGVYNRRFFDHEGNKLFQTCLRHSKPIGIIVGDIDDFKIFNDRYGHQEGDVALQLVSSIMNDFLKERDGFIARYGGEEFVIVLEQPKNIEGLCRNICRTISDKKMMLTDGSYVNVTISLGACIRIPKNHETLDLFVKKADDAMYQAKRSGKNKYIIT